MNVIKWGNSDAFGYILLLILFTVLFYIFERRQKNKLHRFFGDRVTKWLTRNVSLQKRRQQLFLQVLGLAFVILALARPQMGQSEQEIKSEGIELIILADVSESMLAEDIKPSRLQQMKIELSKLIDYMPGNKTGLIAFAGSSALMSPLTSDPGALKMYIDSLETFSVSSQGTQFGLALDHVTEAFEKGGVTQDEKTKTTRVILIASDGEDHDTEALSKVEELRKKGYYFITIAYGTEQGASIPTRDRNGNLIGSKKDSSGQVVLTQVKGDFLKKIAEKGEGRFYFSNYQGDHLKQIVEAINQYEKEEFSSAFAVQYDEKFTWPLLLGLLLLILSLFIDDVDRSVRVWKGQYEV